MHNLQSLGTASLDTFGGLVTNVNPTDLPEGASPRTWDTDFIIGSVFTRPGLQSVYTYTNVLTISEVVIAYQVATFTYSGTTPAINESFVLSGFTAGAEFLNGQTVFVTFVNPSGSTFNVDFSHIDAGPFLNQNSSAVSTTGNFSGPNAPTNAEVIDSEGNTWTNPDGILTALTYASSTTGSTISSTVTPGAAANDSSTNPWTNPSNILSSGAPVATVTISGSSLVTGFSSSILANGMSYALPADATVVGISTSFSGSSTGAAGSSSVSVQLATNGFAIGTAVNVPVSSSTETYTQGSAAYQWGTTLSTDIVNGSAFGILVQARQTSGSGTFSVNTLSVTVYYTTSSSSEVLQATQLTFSVPSTSGVSGFGVAFQAYSSAATSVTLQLLKFSADGPVAVGTAKTQVLTTTPTVYSLGAEIDLWGDVWVYSDVNNTEFGVQITAEGTGTTFINDLDIIAYLTPGKANFNYVKSFVQNDGQIDTLALDASGILWIEDVTNLPGKLSIALTGLLPGSFAKSATALDQEYILFSDLSVGTDRPRVYNGTSFFPLSQVGPGAPPAFVSSVGSSGDTLSLTNFSITSNVVTFDYTGTQPTAGQLYAITGASPSYLNITATVLGTGLSATQFQMALTHANVGSTPISPAATATLQFSYPITSITQLGPNPTQAVWEALLWSAGPGSTAPGTVLTVYYALTAYNLNILNMLNAGQTVYVRITGTKPGFNGTYLVTSASFAKPPGLDHMRQYFTVDVGTSGFFYEHGGGTSGVYQQTIATLTVSSPIPNIVQGDTINITESSPAGWNASWPVVNTLKSGVLNITGTSMSSTGVATYQFNVQSGVGPTAGEIVNVTNCTNNAVFNAIGLIATVVGSNFTVNGFPAEAIPFATETLAVAVTFGTQFQIDPGAVTLGTGTNPIYGNSSSGVVTVTGGSVVPIGAGTRQAVVFFITESGYETAVSPPVVFTTSSDANFINVSKIPIGPPNVIARGIAFTEAGQNGVPGANFYVIPDDVVITVGNITTKYTSTIIRDNVSTTAKFTFTDAVLLNSTEVDVQGNNLFNLIELGSSSWCIPYASRMFYGLQLNKVDNFVNLTFDGGYLPNPGGALFPLGWTSVTGGIGIDLQVSPVTGMALYIFNDTGGTSTAVGLISQPAFQDPYQVPIIRPNTTYSVRVACSCPSGINVGVLLLTLADFNPEIGYGAVYGTFAVDLADMTSNTAVFSGDLLTSPFLQSVSPQLHFAIQVNDMVANADLLIDRIEVYPTRQPYLLTQVFGSYVNNLEAIDASGTGGILDTSAENSQSCMGAFVMHDNLYLLKTNSMLSTQDNPNSEPGGWGLHEVSNRVGTIGINSYDTGEEWIVTACRSGIYGFNGGQPVKLMQEIWNVWEAINWTYGNAIVLRNDIVNKRILCAIPLPTGTNPTTHEQTTSVKWMPNAPYNPNPTTPNVMLMLNYQGLGSFESLVDSPEVHTTMFGTLAAVDMKRKWSIWQIPSPYMDFVTLPDGESHPLYICNGIASSKIYQLMDDKLSDDGVAINGLYTTYGFVNAEKAATVPIFGYHAKRYMTLQFSNNGAGSEQIRILSNTLGALRPYTVPNGVTLQDPALDDYFRPLNVRGNRAFIEFSTNAVGSWFQLSKVMLSGKADPWAAINPTGGGNSGQG